MQVRVQEITPTKLVVIKGDEPWLKPIIAAVQESENAAASTITGELHLRSDAAGFVYGKGIIKHTPLLTCGRCDKEVPWEIEAPVDVSWRPAYETHAPREISLTAEDLDVYFIENGCVDIEQLVLDTLLCALPEQIPVRRNDSDECGICGVSLKGGLVYGDNVDIERESPFAILKNLKS